LFSQSRVDPVEEGDTSDDDDALRGVERQTKRKLNTFCLEEDRLLLTRVLKT
jgi:hypothetical protein